MSVDPSSGTFVANAFVVMRQEPGCGADFQNDWSGPRGDGERCNGRFHDDWASGQAMATPRQVTITTNASTTFRVNGQQGTISGLAAGDRFVAVFNGSPSDSLQTIVSSPAVAVYAHTPAAQHQLYAFVGTVTAVSTTADTVSVNVTGSIPSGLIPSSSNPATFTISPDTLILGANATNGLFGGTLSGVSVGDVVAGGPVGTAGETLAQVESSPLQVLVAFPVASSSTTTTASTRRATQTALGRALALLGFKAQTAHGRKGAAITPGGTAITPGGTATAPPRASTVSGRERTRVTTPVRQGEPRAWTRLASTSRPPRAVPRGLLRLRSEAALGERFAAGDESAFAVLYERHHALVLAISIAVLGSRQDAEDAAQETFAALAVTLRKHPPRELRPWLVRVSRNAAIDLARRRRVHPPLGEASVDPRSLGGGIQHELDSVLAGIRELPESQRTALLLRELAGHSYGEIATMLNTDQGAVRGLIARARIGLRNYREATELPCAAVRAALAAEPDGRRRDKAVRRHLRACTPCQAYRTALRSDAKALRALAPAPVGGLAGGGAAASLAAKGALAGGALSQVGAVCAASVCSVGGFVMLYEHGIGHRLRPPSRASASVVRRHPASAHSRLELAGATGGVAIGGRSVDRGAPRTAPGSAEGPVATRRRANRSANQTRTGLSVSLAWLDRHRSQHASGGPFSAGKPVSAVTRPVAANHGAGADGPSLYGAAQGIGSGRKDAGAAGGWSEGRRGTRTGGGTAGSPEGARPGADRGSGGPSGQAAPETGMRFDRAAQGAGRWAESGQPAARPRDVTARTASRPRHGSARSRASGGSGPTGGSGSGGGPGGGSGPGSASADNTSGIATTPGDGSGGATTPSTVASAP